MALRCVDEPYFIRRHMRGDHGGNDLKRVKANGEKVLQAAYLSVFGGRHSDELVDRAERAHCVHDEARAGTAQIAQNCNLFGHHESLLPG